MFRPLLMWSLLLILPASTIYAQSSKKNKADKMFCEWAFNEAINLYQEIIDEYDSTQIDPDVYYKLGECYRLMDKPDEAVVWYGESVKHPDNSPLDYYQYARMLQKVERYPEAGQWFSVYNDTTGNKKGARGMHAAGNLQDIASNPLKVEVKNAVSINSRRSEMGPTFYGDGLVFSSDRYEGTYGSKTFKWTGNSFYNIYYAKQDGNYNFQSPQLFIATISSQYHDGPTAFTTDEKQMIFTRNHSKPELDKGGECKNRTIYNLKLVQTVNDDKSGWQRASEDPFVNLNSVDHTIAHPALSSDGKTLYFTSDNDEFPGHQGGSDLYMAKLEGGVWVAPTNLGSAINSEEDEGFPYIYQDSILFFASDGNIGNGGLGGLDVYMATWNQETGKFSSPTNLGTPINSSRDDFGLIVKEKEEGQFYGYFTSSRTAMQDPLKVGGDDIYYFYPAQSLDILVLARHTETKAPFDAATISVLKVRDTMTKGSTNTDGQFFDSGVLDINKSYTVTAQIGGVEVLKTVSTANYEYGDTVVVILEYCPVEVTGVATNYLTGQPLAGVELEVTDQKSNTTFTTTTDEAGTYTFSAESNTTYQISAYKFGYRINEQEVSTAGKNCETINVPLSMLTSDRFLTNVYYFFDKADIYLYEESVNDLEDLVEFLGENPNLKVELRAHTDSRGSFAYNEKLAQRRAQSVKDFLIDKNIDADRLTPVAYGEYCLTNECADGVECNEVQHQRNRRTEIVVTNLEGEIVAQGKELDRWTKQEDTYVEGGKYYEQGKGSNWFVKEVFSGKYGNWRKVAIRKTCD